MFHMVRDKKSLGAKETHITGKRQAASKTSVWNNKPKEQSRLQHAPPTRLNEEDPRVFL